MGIIPEIADSDAGLCGLICDSQRTVAINLPGYLEDCGLLAFNRSVF
jgi:hypothetical protein